jgi:hypothetical protein
MKTLPIAPQASRRALLMGFAAAATPMAPALANALSEPAPAAADPIFAVIAEHQAASEGVIAAFARDHRETDDDEITDAAQERLGDVELFTTAPTTVAGVAAFLDYIGTDEIAYEPDLTILEYACEGRSDAVREFTTFLAAALRNIIERGQA